MSSSTNTPPAGSRGAMHGSGHTAATAARRAAAASGYPIVDVLDELCQRVQHDHVVVLEAPVGAGKTTVVPLALLDVITTGRVVVLEPRRVAARAAALRLAAIVGEPLGRTVGLTTRDERRVSRATRVEVVTEGVLLRRLQRDPELPGTALVMFDEFHERNLDADLSLAFAMQVRETLRDDLRLVVASATLDGRRIAHLLGGAPVVEATGRSYPITVEHRPRPHRDDLPAAIRDEVAAWLDGPEAGDVLVFLPGAAEIRRVGGALAEPPLPDAPLVLPLHGALPAEAQDAALAEAPPGRHKVVLATDVAESSLTIDGVRCVIDAGWSREPRFDPTTAMTGLVTVPASKAAADQRAGRAGRTAPGHAIRLWPLDEHATRDAYPRPQIITDDLTGAALQMAAWGASPDELALLDRPTVATWERAQTTLMELGALDATGRLTAHGKALVEVPVHPRLAHLLRRGEELGLGELACQVAAVLGDRDPFVGIGGATTSDLTARVAVVAGRPAPRGAKVRRGALARLRRDVARLRTYLGADGGGRQASTNRRRTGDGEHRPSDGSASFATDVGRLVAIGWPDQVARRRQGRRGAFLLASGRGAELPDGDVLAGEDWIAVASVDRGHQVARIRLAAPVDPDLLRQDLDSRVEQVEQVAWRGGDVAAERRIEFGALVLERQRLADPASDQLLTALLDGIRSEGLDLLPWREADRQLQARLGLLHRVLGAPWPDVSDAALLADLDTRVAPYLLQARRRRDLAKVDVHELLLGTLDHHQRQRVGRLVPTHLTVPSGSRITLDYRSGDEPVLAVRIQEMFGATTTPTIVDGRVPVLLHLLSPAHRPVQITDDLAGFWHRAYPAIRAELRGRYPKHDWPEDPLTAPPRRRVRPRPR